MKKTVIGALAHVDAGKTTLAEAILYNTNSINEMGRVDKSSAFLDYNSLERQRGITIFNKEARFTYHDRDYIYFDTPGHTELNIEKQRAYQILDLALLIISGSDGVTTDTIRTYNELLSYNIPIIVFVNKMDIDYLDRTAILKDIQEKLSDNCLELNEIKEAVALNDEKLLNDYLNSKLDDSYVAGAISDGLYSPVLFGSALKNEGVKELLEVIVKYVKTEESPDREFKAYVYKITNDNNERLTHVKVLSGSLTNRSLINDEKVNEIRLYTGRKYANVNQVGEGELCALKGLDKTLIGEYLPEGEKTKPQHLNNLTYEIISTTDTNELIRKIAVLNEEKPELNICAHNRHIYINLEGELQKELIRETIKERFNENVDFSEPLIIYKESVKEESYGVGHFEPLRHYAEVIVTVKPDEGLKFRSLVNNQYTGAMISYLEHHTPRGILTNSYLTNVCITIVDFKTHPKHTEGGDLINALKRAIRFALSRNVSVLLEPYYLTNISYSDETLNQIIPELNNAKAIYTIETSSLMCKIPETRFNDLILNLKSRLKDNLDYEILDQVYDEATEKEKVIESFAYDYRSDNFNPVGSIFTSKGAGHYVEPEDVEGMMHLNLSDYFKDVNTQSTRHIHSTVSEEELKKVWNSLYKPKPRLIRKNRKDEDDPIKPVDLTYKPLIYVVDGYNLMYSIEELKDLSSANFMAARDKVTDIVQDFKGYVNADMLLVFDAYNNDYSRPQVTSDGDLTIVYTRHNQTADDYIEDVTEKLSDKYKVITVTSDYLEQIRVLSNSSLRLSSREFMMRYENFRKNNLTKQELPKNKPLKELKSLLEE